MFDVQVVTYFYYNFDSWQYFYSNHVYCLYVNVMETNKIRLNVAETEFLYTFDIFTDVY